MPDEYLAKSPDAGRMGKAVEHLVAASCIISSGAQLNVSTAMVDDEGVDLVFHRRGGSATLAVQVKARLSTSKRVQSGGFVAFVRRQTFRPRPDLYMLFVAVDVPTGTYDTVWLVPSQALSTAGTSGGKLRFAASMKPGTKNKWVQYQMTRSELPERIMELLHEREAPGQ